MQDFIIKIFGIKTYEKENGELASANLALVRELERLKKAHKQLVDMYKKLEKASESPLEYANEQITAMETIYKRMAREYDESLEIMTKRLNAQDNEVHRAFAEGRQCAYSEMGIRNIEAHERGNILIRLPDGEIVEQILGLEDVEIIPLKQATEFSGSLDEIPIDDLAIDSNT